MERNEQYWLLSIITVVLLTRLVLAFYIPNFTYDSYFHLRQVEQITNKGIPLFNDPLSYGGRELRFLPLFHYIMAFFDLFLPLELVAKIIPNIFLTGLVVIVYLLSKKISQDTTASLFSAVIAGFLPILFSTNKFTPETLFIPLIFLSIYFFLHVPEKKYINHYLAAFALLCLISSATALYLIGLGIYFLLSLAEGKKITRAEGEMIIFSVFLFLWVQLLFFKSTLLTEGISFIWQNIPSALLQEYFPTFSVVQALGLVSIVPFVGGVYVVYDSLFQLKNKKAFLLISLALSTTVLTWFRLIEFELSLSFFAVILAVLFSLFYQRLGEYLKTTKGAHLTSKLPIMVLAVLIASTIYPAMSAALTQDVPSAGEVKAFQWLEQNTSPDTTVLGLLAEGNLITYYGQRKNIIDENFRLIEDINTRFLDHKELFTTKFQTLAVDLFEKYGIDYIIISPHAQRKYGRDNVDYLSIDCFERVYKEEVRIYKVKCKLGKVS